MMSFTSGCPWTRTRSTASINPGVFGEDVEEDCKPSQVSGPIKNCQSVYRYGSLITWLFISALLVLDRFYWNVWPRQAICTQGCGVDFFCEMDGDPGCLKKGPWTAKAFDFIARVSARMIISTTSLVNFGVMNASDWEKENIGQVKVILARRCDRVKVIGCRFNPLGYLVVLVMALFSLMFLTMCHGTWNALSELSALKPFLHNWREDNYWLHTIGGWTIGVLTIAHVWSLLLPSIFHGYANRAIPGAIDYPAQVPLGVPQIDVEKEDANWGYDDIWRIVWMTIIFGALMPLSRSMWFLKKNFSLAMWLHMGVGIGFFIDSARRRTHPHVWILNLPFVLWYMIDKILCATVLRVDPCADAIRIKLDDEYMLLLWKDDDEKPKMMCDIFWVKRGFDSSDPARSGGEPRRTGELSHPFTTCSSHEVTVSSAFETSASSGAVSTVRACIEAPIHTDVAWPGHRFTLTSVLTPKVHPPQRSNSQDGRRTPWNMGARRRTPSRPLVQKTGSQSWCGSSSPARNRASRVTSDLTPPSEDEENAGDLSYQPHKACQLDQEKDGTVIGVDVAGGYDSQMKMILGKIEPMRREMSGRSTISEAVDDFFDTSDDDTGHDEGDSSGDGSGDGDDEDDGDVEDVRHCDGIMYTTDKLSDVPGSTSIVQKHRVSAPIHISEAKGIMGKIAAGKILSRSSSRVGAKTRTNGDDVNVAGRTRLTSASRTSSTAAGGGGGGGGGGRAGGRAASAASGTGTGASAASGRGRTKKTMLVRMASHQFKEYRQWEMDEGRGRVLPGTWNKMAIVRIYRRPAPKVREFTCLGVTYTVTSSRRPETGRIADLEAAEHDEVVPLRTYGPYRSAYGRLCEFPNLPPLLVVGTGAGAALVLDFVAYVRANNLVPIRPVTVCYSASSLPLLQFVTNTLLAERTSGIDIKTALTRHDDLELFDTSAEAGKELKMGRLDVEEIMASLPRETEVYFCGGGAVNRLLRKRCAARGMPYTGSSVQ